MTRPLIFKPFLHENKTQALSRHLAELAVEMGPGAKFPTVAQLCDTMGVSIMTLNRALSDLEARGLILRRHAVGIFVTNRAAQKTIGLVSAFDVSSHGLSPFWWMVVQASRERALSANEKVRIYLAEPTQGKSEPPDDLVEDVEAGRLHGVIVLGRNDPLDQWLMDQAIPAVSFGGGGVLPDRVVLDTVEEVRLGVRALVESGCRDIGIWGPRSASAHTFAEAPFREELLAAGIEFRSELCHYPDGDLCHYQSVGQDLAMQVFGRGSSVRRPDGLVILDDVMTRGALTTLHRLGLHAGQDVIIAGHANKSSSVLHGYEHCLIRLEFDPAEIVQGLFALLDAQLQGAPLPSPVTTLRPHLILPGQ